MIGWAARTVHVRQRVGGAKDDFGNDVVTYAEPVDVGGVYVAPSTADDDIEDGRPDGAVVIYSLYVPKGAPEIEWRGAKVGIDGLDGEYDVISVERGWPTPPGFTHDTVVRVVRHLG